MFDWSFLVLTNSYCSSPIATNDLGCAVTPLFDPPVTRSFPLFSYKEVPDLQKINLFMFILFNFFLRKYHHPLPSCSQHPWNPKLNRTYIFAKRTFMIKQCHHTQTLYKTIPFDLWGFDIKSKGNFIFNISYNFLNLNLHFTDFQHHILLKLLLQLKKMQNIPTCYNIYRLI